MNGDRSVSLLGDSSKTNGRYHPESESFRSCCGKDCVQDLREDLQEDLREDLQEDLRDSLQDLREDLQEDRDSVTKTFDVLLVGDDSEYDMYRVNQRCDDFSLQIVSQV